MWKFLGTPTVQGAISGAVVALVGTILNNYINVKNNNKIIKSNLENLEKTLNHNKENLEKEHNFRKNQEDKKKLKQTLESILEEIVADDLIIKDVFSELEEFRNKEERFINSPNLSIKHKYIKSKYNYRPKFDKAFVLSLMYFRELHELILAYKKKTEKIYDFLASERVSPSFLKDSFKDEYDPYEQQNLGHGFGNFISGGRRGIYNKIIKKVKEEIEKLNKE